MREGLITYKIAADVADIACHRSGAWDRDDELSHARYGCDWTKPIELSLYPERAKPYHSETLPADIYKQAEFCSMRCSKHSPMKTKITYEELEGLKKSLQSKGKAVLSA